MRQCAALVVLSVLSAASASAEVVAASGDASIARGEDGKTWSLAAGGATLTLQAGASSDFGVVQLTSPSGHVWSLGPPHDTSLTVSGKVLPFGNRTAGFAFESANVIRTGSQLRFDAVFSLEPSGLLVTRHYALVDGSPTFETWTTIERTTRRHAVRVANLNGIDVIVPAGKVHWLTGLDGDNASATHDAAFSLQSRTLASGERLSLSAAGRSSEKTVPWIAIDGAPDEFYASLMWSGAWSLTVNASAAGLSLTFGLASMDTLVETQPVDGPHVLFGVVRGGTWTASAALQSYVLGGVRQGRPLPALVTYNTWFAYGVRIDEEAMRGEMIRAAALGTELFVIDAGWYPGAGAGGPFDFDSGLGTWQVDAARFPNGLAPLRDYAHSLGMKFGIWVEPERVNLDTVGEPGLAQEPWLVTNGGSYGADHAALICLSGAAGRQWVTTQLTQFLDSVRPDYLKWDNNLWVNCDRPGHGHGAKDGNFAQVNGLYTLLDTLRTRYPDLLIENVGGGGARLDLSMLRYSDVAWMDDRTAPSVHVRHNIEGLSVLFPPAYLLSFVIDSGEEPLIGAPDFSLDFRSRMEGVLGLSFRSVIWSDEDQAAVQGEIATYKGVRDVLSRATGTMLTGQAKVLNGPGWDVFQETAPHGPQILLWAFQSDSGSRSITIKPTGLDAHTQYDVDSVDAGRLGTVSGSYLAENGIEVSTSTASAAHLIILTARP